MALLLGGALPKHHLSGETKETVKVAMGLVATMAALILGLLVASAKGSYDTEKSEVVSMAAKVSFLDRTLAMYGPESAPAREALRRALEMMIVRVWPQTASAHSQLDPHTASAEATYRAIQQLSPTTDDQRSLKAQALG